jgi:hypothetical protein
VVGLQVDGFVTWNLVRSKDEYVKWPLGSGDSLAAVIRPGHDPIRRQGRRRRPLYHYQVFGLRSWNGETIIACRNGAHRYPAPTPKPSRPTVVPPCGS